MNLYLRYTLWVASFFPYGEPLRILFPNKHVKVTRESDGILSIPNAAVETVLQDLAWVQEIDD
ncbi:BnaA02g36190D [Brassica napus]|uniref:(rape) hypothetical protein n=1 Tax=Brassica napus TaxID=3708 RepID=A0A078J3G4_BRANA|nr:unnamed protein product [Brassica napus]CDY56806.1 BnaA02g36190D [Brassica napus]